MQRVLLISAQSGQLLFKHIFYPGPPSASDTFTFSTPHPASTNSTQPHQTHHKRQHGDDHNPTVHSTSNKSNRSDSAGSSKVRSRSIHQSQFGSPHSSEASGVLREGGGTSSVAGSALLVHVMVDDMDAAEVEIQRTQAEARGGEEDEEAVDMDDLDDAVQGRVAAAFYFLLIQASQAFPKAVDQVPGVQPFRLAITEWRSSQMLHVFTYAPLLDIICVLSVDFSLQGIGLQFAQLLCERLQATLGKEVEQRMSKGPRARSRNLASQTVWSQSTVEGGKAGPVIEGKGQLPRVEALYSLHEVQLRASIVQQIIHSLSTGRRLLCGCIKASLVDMQLHIAATMCHKLALISCVPTTVIVCQTLDLPLDVVRQAPRSSMTQQSSSVDKSRKKVSSTLVAIKESKGFSFASLLQTMCGCFLPPQPNSFEQDTGERGQHTYFSSGRPGANRRSKSVDSQRPGGGQPQGTFNNPLNSPGLGGKVRGGGAGGRQEALLCSWDHGAGMLRLNPSVKVLQYFDSWLVEAVGQIRQVAASSQQFKVVQLVIQLLGPSSMLSQSMSEARQEANSEIEFHSNDIVGDRGIGGLGKQRQRMHTRYKSQQMGRYLDMGEGMGWIGGEHHHHVHHTHHQQILQQHPLPPSLHGTLHAQMHAQIHAQMHAQLHGVGQTMGRVGPPQPGRPPTHAHPLVEGAPVDRGAQHVYQARIQGVQGPVGSYYAGAPLGSDGLDGGFRIHLGENQQQQQQQYQGGVGGVFGQGWQDVSAAGPVFEGSIQQYEQYKQHEWVVGQLQGGGDTTHSVHQFDCSQQLVAVDKLSFEGEGCSQQADLVKVVSEQDSRSQGEAEHGECSGVQHVSDDMQKLCVKEFTGTPLGESRVNSIAQGSPLSFGFRLPGSNPVGTNVAGYSGLSYERRSAGSVQSASLPHSSFSAFNWSGSQGQQEFVYFMVGLTAVVGFQTQASVGMNEVEELVARQLADDMGFLEGMMAAVDGLRGEGC